MKGYLLDTNIWRYWFDPNKPEHAAVDAAIARLPPETPLFASAVTLGEIEFGHRVLGDTVDSDSEMAVSMFISEHIRYVLTVEKKTTKPYGSLRARLFNKYAPRERRKKGQRPEQLIDPVTSLHLGIQENDLWIAAQALEYNLVLVTHDAMVRIRSVAAELRVEDWARQI